MYPGNGDAGAQPERSPAARVSREDVLAWMRGHLARLLGVAPDDLDPHEHFLDLGVDSVQAMALLEAIAEELQIALAPEVFFDYPTMVDLAGHLMSAYPEQLGQRLRPVPEPALTPALTPQPPLPQAGEGEPYRPSRGE